MINQKLIKQKIENLTNRKNEKNDVTKTFR